MGIKLQLEGLIWNGEDLSANQQNIEIAKFTFEKEHEYNRDEWTRILSEQQKRVAGMPEIYKYLTLINDEANKKNQLAVERREEILNFFDAANNRLIDDRKTILTATVAEFDLTSEIVNIQYNDDLDELSMKIDATVRFPGYGRTRLVDIYTLPESKAYIGALFETEDVPSKLITTLIETTGHPLTDIDLWTGTKLSLEENPIRPISISTWDVLRRPAIGGHIAEPDLRGYVLAVKE